MVADAWCNEEKWSKDIMASALVCLLPGKCPVTSEYLSEVTGQMAWIWDIFLDMDMLTFVRRNM